MNVGLKPISSAYKKEIIDILNYYVVNSFAAFAEDKLAYDFFEKLQEMCSGYPAVIAEDDNGVVLGFGLLRTYNATSTFSQVAEITTFLRHGHTGKGIGKTILDFLEKEGKHQGLTSILASISSLNDGSINFYSKNGFIKCGQFLDICKKKNKSFDIIYMQKKL